MFGLSTLDRFRPSVLALLLCVLVAGGALVVSGAGGYSLTVAESSDGIDGVDVPQRTVTVEGTEYTVSEIGRVEKGQPIRVTVGAPDGEQVDVTLRTHENQVDQSDADVSDGTTVEFSSSDLSPGTYYAALYADGQTRTIVPIVVSGYDVAVTDAPDRVTRGETATVTASATATASSGDPHRVEVVVGDDSEAVRVDASRSGGDYVAEVPTDDLPSGEYAVYAVARGEEEARDGEKELVGVSDRRTLTVAAGDATPTESGDGGGTGGAGGGDGGSPTATPTATGPTPTGDDPTETSHTPTTSGTDSSDADATPTATPTDGSITTPATEPTGTSTPARTDGQPGLGVVAALAALVAGGVLLRRRDGH